MKRNWAGIRSFGLHIATGLLLTDRASTFYRTPATPALTDAEPRFVPVAECDAIANASHEHYQSAVKTRPRQRVFTIEGNP